MTTPRTISGQAALSALRPHYKRAIGGTILAIEREAIAPYLEALREVDELLEDLAAKDTTAAWDSASRVDVVSRAGAAHLLVRPLLA